MAENKMIKFCPDLTTFEEVKEVLRGTGDFTRAVLHACLRHDCTAYANGRCLKYNNDVKKEVKENRFYKIEKPILDDVEKRYLEGVLRPFKDRVLWIVKRKSNDREFIIVKINSIRKQCFTTLDFPFFKENTMYKGLEPNKKYTLKELGLFGDD